MSGEVLSQESIAKLLRETPSLVSEYLSLAEQLQPNGFDLTLRDVSELTGPGRMGQDSTDRKLADCRPLEFNLEGWLKLPPGAYLITFNEIVALPNDLMALGRPRSSLLRSGVSIHTAVWDAGYQGRSQALLVVHHPMGYLLQKDARLLQLVFFRLGSAVEQGYQGRYQLENI